jgi:hypothetical protein
MVLGRDSSPYLSASLGGPFLNYHMSKSYLDQEKTLQQKALLFQMLRQQTPERVLDQEGLFRQLLEELPALKEYYTEAGPGIFTKK